MAHQAPEGVGGRFPAHSPRGFRAIAAFRVTVRGFAARRAAYVVEVLRPSLIHPVGGHGVLNEIVSADGEEIGLPGQRASLIWTAAGVSIITPTGISPPNGASWRRSCARPGPGAPWPRAALLREAIMGNMTFTFPERPARRTAPELGEEQLTPVKTQPDCAAAQEGVGLPGQGQILRLLVSADVQGADNDLTSPPGRRRRRSGGTAPPPWGNGPPPGR